MLQNKEHHTDLGFTLIELLVVIAIIGLLASIVLVSFPNATRKAHDATRLQNVQQILTALRIYKSSNNAYPARTADSCCDGWDQGPCNGNNTFINGLITSGTINTVPVDPTNKSGTGCYGFNYYVYNAGSYGCDASRGRFFVLGIRDMETSNRPQADSPGWSCPSRNWQSEFDWVTGSFEND